MVSVSVNGRNNVMFGILLPSNFFLNFEPRNVTWVEPSVKDNYCTLAVIPRTILQIRTFILLSVMMADYCGELSWYISQCLFCAIKQINYSTRQDSDRDLCAQYVNGVRG